ncbi:MAG: glycoside hydrolase 43 family protein [Paludibacter sp. 47-17]|nr:MAG: glycoside hydrolase 43 family protein [Paludibacter sp. 47-17]
MSTSRNLVLVVGLLLVLVAPAQEAPATFSNPILPGYHPDPSICRVGDDYYLVNSSFVWFPGLPVYHSKDLVNWKLIGHAIDRSDQLSFEGLPDMLGLFAPTIRYHDGLFYIVNTCVGCGMNFYITATHPAGPWSDPVWLTDAPGIDPSLMWDDDGTCYYTGVAGVEPPAWPNQGMIFNQKLDLTQQKLVGERHILTYGHANNASYSEGPHLYKVDGKYLLLISEGGTEMYHAMTAHHSDSVNGPYQADYINPVLTHRHLGQEYPIQAIGHGDLVQTQNGEWWCVMLGKRVLSSYTTLGRETFLAKVSFEGRTPVFNAGTGKVQTGQKRPDLPWTPVENVPDKEEFEADQLPLNWYTNRTPCELFYTLEAGTVKLKLRREVMDSLTHSSVLFRRVEHHRFKAQTKLAFSTRHADEQAGLTLYRTNENYYNLLKEKDALVLYRSFKGKKQEVARVAYRPHEVYLQVEVKDLEVRFSYGESLCELKGIGEVESMVVLADLQGNALFNGPGIGIYATSNGKASESIAGFDWFYYSAADL